MARIVAERTVKDFILIALDRVVVLLVNAMAFYTSTKRILGVSVTPSSALASDIVLNSDDHALFERACIPCGVYWDALDTTQPTMATGTNH
jgi:hypothetical protein